MESEDKLDLSKVTQGRSKPETKYLTLLASSTTPFTSKLIECTIYGRCLKFFCSNSIIDSLQYDFCSSSPPTETVLAKVSNDLFLAKAQFSIDTKSSMWKLWKMYSRYSWSKAMKRHMTHPSGWHLDPTWLKKSSLKNTDYPGWGFNT